MAPFSILTAFLATVPAIGQAAVSQSADSTMVDDNEGMVLLQTRAGVFSRRLSPDNQSDANATDGEFVPEMALVSSASNVSNSNVSVSAMAAAIEALASAEALVPEADHAAEGEMVNVSTPVLAAVITSMIESVANSSSGMEFQSVSVNGTNQSLSAVKDLPSDTDGAASLDSNGTVGLQQESPNISASRSQETPSPNASAQDTPSCSRDGCSTTPRPEVTITPHVFETVAANRSDLVVVNASISSNETHSASKQNVSSNATSEQENVAEHGAASNTSSSQGVGADSSEVANITSAPAAIVEHVASSNVTSAQEAEVEHGVVSNASSIPSVEADNSNISNVASAPEVTVENLVLSNATSAQETEHSAVLNASSRQAVAAEQADYSNVSSSPAATLQHNISTNATSANATSAQAADTEHDSDIVSATNESGPLANATSAGAKLAETTPSIVGALQHGGKDCWNSCGHKSGLCGGFCGTGNACCRKGWGQNPAICDGVNHTTKKHECVTPIKATYSQEKSSMCGVCSDESGLPVGDTGDGLDAATRQTALSVCGAVCEQHVDCSGFNFEEASGLCRYRRALSCVSSSDEGHDCYTKVSAMKEKLWEVHHDVMEKTVELAAVNQSYRELSEQDMTTKNSAGGGRSANALFVLAVFAAAFSAAEAGRL